ncbi:hypothetical protein BE04_45360 [Sorangium cellulosum]|uniref:Uncharacterized protein n=1 Tax=Sorangium cellulosum TaxID=56 RepID=A0A150P637_SORCE|nr:hypothetical protein BE04_45360 [Sorangium cellulosum]
MSDLGTMQRMSGAIEPWAGVVVGPARIEAGASFWPGRRAESAARPGTGGTIDLVAGSLTACALLPPLERAVRPDVEVDVPCAGVELGRMHAEGYGVSDPGEGSGVWVALRSGAAASWVVAPWMRLRLRLEAVVPLERPRAARAPALRARRRRRGPRAERRGAGGPGARARVVTGAVVFFTESARAGHGREWPPVPSP